MSNDEAKTNLSKPTSVAKPVYIKNDWLKGTTQTSRVSSISTLVGYHGQVRAFDENSSMVFMEESHKADDIFDELKAHLSSTLNRRSSTTHLILACGSFIYLDSVKNVRLLEVDDEETVLLVIGMNDRALYVFSSYEYQKLDELENEIGSVLQGKSSSIDWPRYVKNETKAIETK